MFWKLGNAEVVLPVLRAAPAVHSGDRRQLRSTRGTCSAKLTLRIRWLAFRILLGTIDSCLALGEPEIGCLSVASTMRCVNIASWKPPVADLRQETSSAFNLQVARLEQEILLSLEEECLCHGVCSLLGNRLSSVGICLLERKEVLGNTTTLQFRA